MVREFEEEAGVYIEERRWTKTVQLSGPHDGGWEVTFYHCFLTLQECQKCETQTDEPLEWVGVRMLSTKNVVHNLRWLVPIQLDRNLRWPLDIEEVE